MPEALAWGKVGRSPIPQRRDGIGDGSGDGVFTRAEASLQTHQQSP